GKASALSVILPKQLAEKHLFPCHRLDKETSGLLIFAKGTEARDNMFKLFREHAVKKKYLAFVHGRPGKREGIASSVIDGKKAVTKYTVLNTYRDFSVIEAEPVTGRRNQIRIHMKSVGHPIVGERKFSFGKDYELKFRRCALHAYRLEFQHPYTGKLIRLKNALPDDMKTFLERNNAVLSLK
ncbi:MAG: RNA pseudouridine synthase, partial [Candidatus Aureabacteria bacterium]|nr:RNA pseudouridine synthase [Candidatus Auribacterota bacterium]